MVIAKKSLGQNFLKDPEVLADIIEASELSKDDTILEIGPGKGALTQELIEHVGKVISVELDGRLIPVLQNNFGHEPNFTLHHEDALNFIPPNEPYKIVANFPYYITSPLLNHYLKKQFQDGSPPSLMVVMVQKEVAKKIVAKKGKHSVLSLEVHLFGDPELVRIVPRDAFDPKPKVESAILKIRVHNKPKIKGDLDKLFWLFKMSFAQKRKKLTNNLAGALRKEPKEIKGLLEQLKINPNTRAEALTLEEWETLFQSINSFLKKSESIHAEIQTGAITGKKAW